MSCKCQDCGNKYDIDLMIPDELWVQIKPEGKSNWGGLLCGSCIMKRLEELSLFGVLHIESGHFQIRGGDKMVLFHKPFNMRKVIIKKG